MTRAGRPAPLGSLAPRRQGGFHASRSDPALGPNGAEEARYSGPAARDGDAFPSRFVVFDVFVDDRPETLKRPVVP